MLKRVFYVVSDIIAGRDHLGLDERCWRFLRYVLLGILGCLLMWVTFSAAKHHQDVSTILSEFLSTWPAARVTETFKLMSLWGVLVEYAMPDPRPENKPSHERDALYTPNSSKSVSRRPTPGSPALARAIVDPKREPLLANPQNV